MNWDPFQREVLAELGHVLYRSTLSTNDGLSGDLPIAESATADAELLARLARAAGVTVEGLPATVQEPSALAGLRGDSSAKRALWPRLRAMRSRPQ